MAEGITKVGVFIDWQNCYRTARDAFGLGSHPGIAGNVKPLALAKILASRRGDAGRGVLVKARVYAGMASQRQDQQTYDANQRQFQAWRNSGSEIEVITRTLDYSLGRPREKGIDVALAIDVVRYTLLRREHDIAIVVSADTDLLPALEAVAAELGTSAVEVATWDGPNWAPAPLSLAGQRVRQHLMDRTLYERIADRTDYSQSSPRRGQGTQGRRLPPR